LRYGLLASVAANNDPIDMAFLQKAEDNKQTLRVTSKPLHSFSAAIKRTEAIVQKDGNSLR